MRDTDPALVRRLLAEQFPSWSDLPLTRVGSHGTDNDVYRLGTDLAVRLPIVAWAQRQALLEARWLPLLAPALPLSGYIEAARHRMPPTHTLDSGWFPSFTHMPP